jgi:hypothetical protein
MVLGEHAVRPATLQAARPHPFIRRPTMRPLFLLLPFALVACSTPTTTDAPTMAPSASAALSKGGVEHSVTGSGLEDVAPGFKFTVEASVHSDASGTVSGQIFVRVLDLSLYGVAPYEATEEPTCMRVVGNTAYIGAVVTKTSDPVNAPIGGTAVFWLQDGGPNGTDVGHEGPAWAFDLDGKICTDTPPSGLPAVPITHGNFVVR